MNKSKRHTLNLPVFTKNPRQHAVRSIDEINEWIEHDYKLFFNRELYEKEKKRFSVTVPFKL